jgi:hypothetical protein
MGKSEFNGSFFKNFKGRSLVAKDIALAFREQLCFALKSDHHRKIEKKCW